MYHENVNQERQQREAASTVDSCTFLSKKTRTKVPGKRTIMLDIGSMVNAIGENTLEEFQKTMEPYGYEVQFEERSVPLNLSGVGSGAARCTKIATIPVAAQFKDRSPTLEQYKGNVATGSGADLPAIIGKKSMSDKDSVIILRDGEEMIAFPGPGGYKIEWSPGTKVMSLDQLPSGHLAFQCDMYSKLPDEPTSSSLSFSTDHTRAGQPQE